MNVLVLLVTNLVQADKAEIAYLERIMRQGSGEFEICTVELPSDVKSVAHEDSQGMMRAKIERVESLLSLRPSENLPVIEELL